VPKLSLKKPAAPQRLRLRYLQPLCLALLARQPGSGYELRALLAALPLFADTLPDAPGVYRTLQGFEKRGWLRGRQHPPSKGPTRREYTITPNGRAALTAWQSTLLRAQQELGAVIELVGKPKQPAAQPRIPKPPRKPGKGAIRAS
jgi:DNA-binding PadR family transcriptional regulator